MDANNVRVRVYTTEPEVDPLAGRNSWGALLAEVYASESNRLIGGVFLRFAQGQRFEKVDVSWRGDVGLALLVKAIANEDEHRLLVTAPLGPSLVREFNRERAHEQRLAEAEFLIEVAGPWNQLRYDKDLHLHLLSEDGSDVFDLRGKRRRRNDGAWAPLAPPS